MTFILFFPASRIEIFLGRGNYLYNLCRLFICRFFLLICSKITERAQGQLGDVFGRRPRDDHEFDFFTQWYEI